MMEIAVMISVHPHWCGKIADLLKKLEIRKNFPKIPTPFRCYIYCTKDPKQQFWRSRTYTYVDDRSHNYFDLCGNGRIIGEFICDRVQTFEWSSYEYPNDRNGEYLISDEDLKSTRLSYQQFFNYGNYQPLYGWHISDLVIYDKPKKLSDFYVRKKCNACKESGYEASACIYDEDCIVPAVVTRPPQSWCYVGEVTP